MGDDKAYDGYRSWKGWTTNSFGELSQGDAAYFRSEVRTTGLSMSSPLRVLELGFGHGQFARWAIAQGYDYVGAEVIPDLFQLANANGISAIDATEIKARIPPASLDLIVAFDVFEHLELTALLDQLRLCRELLRPGGRVLARVPSGDSPFGRASQHGDITHRIVLGSSAIRQIAASTGFTVHHVDAPAFPLWGTGIVSAIRRLAVGCLQGLVTRVVRVALHSNNDTVINASMVFVLSRPMVADTAQA